MFTVSAHKNYTKVRVKTRVKYLLFLRKFSCMPKDIVYISIYIYSYSKTGLSSFRYMALEHTPEEKTDQPYLPRSC